MDQGKVLITGISGEVGHGLLETLNKSTPVVGLDINPLEKDLEKYLDEFVQGDILDRALLAKIFEKFNISKIFHFASILSTAAEKQPEKAHRVNVEGTLNLLELAQFYTIKNQSSIKFIFPSTIAVYGLPENLSSNKEVAVKEDQHTNPITMYGLNKLYCENLGVYFSENYKLLDEKQEYSVDFRAVRFPGIISATTMPTGGTSDYAPEMIHSAARGEGYESFVTPDAVLPFMVMPDAIKALIALSKAPTNKLSRRIYNVNGFSATADELANVVNKAFPDSAVSYAPDIKRQKIVDSWPANIDDSAARNDWGWKPEYDLERGFAEYLIPQIKTKYQ